MESLFAEHEKLHKSALKVLVDAAGDVNVLTAILDAVSALHNRLYVLKVYKERVSRDQLRRPSKYVPPGDRITVRDVVIGDPGHVEFFVFPQVAGALAEIVNEFTTRAPVTNAEQVLIPICGHDVEVLHKNKYDAEAVSAFFKAEELASLARHVRGASVSHEEAYYG